MTPNKPYTWNNIQRLIDAGQWDRAVEVIYTILLVSPKRLEDYRFIRIVNDNLEFYNYVMKRSPIYDTQRP